MSLMDKCPHGEWAEICDACDVQPEVQQPKQTATGGSRQYVDPRDGLKAATLATDVLAIGPLAQGIDDRMWSYSNGVWSPDPHVVRNRSGRLLGDKYRRSYGANAEDLIRDQVPVITSEPMVEVINFRNGLYLWKADTMREHDPSVLSTVQLSVDYDPTATCPEFDSFLAQVIPDDMTDMVWELIGYLMMSGNPLHKAVMLLGAGRNGKGTFLRTVTALLGRQNISAVSLHDLTNTRFSTASLFGKIANIAGDIDSTYLETTATFKAVTGEDQISAEHKGRDRFDFTPWAVPVFSANKVPGSADVTSGYLARWVILPFPHSFIGREDPGLSDRLTAKSELMGIAAKAVPALRKLMERHRFTEPASATEATAEFNRRVDQVRTWIDECAEVDARHPWVNRTILYDAYKNWAARDGQRPVKASEFYDRLESIDPAVTAQRLGSQGRGFLGVKVIDYARSPGSPSAYSGGGWIQ